MQLILETMIVEFRGLPTIFASDAGVQRVESGSLRPRLSADVGQKTIFAKAGNQSTIGMLKRLFLSRLLVAIRDTRVRARKKITSSARKAGKMLPPISACNKLNLICSKNRQPIF